jgi:hypothetical protein
MTEETWLRERLDATPHPLRELLEQRVAELDSSLDLPEALLAAACSILDSVHGRLDTREAAYELLAADGLLTLACEAAAWVRPETVAEVCRDMGPGGELGRVAERWVARS